MPGRWLRCALAATLLLAAPGRAAARTLYVNDGGDDCAFAADHTSIQAAVVAAAAEGARRIHVCPGTYEELVTIEGFRRLTLEGESGATIQPPGPLSTGAIVEVRDSRKVAIRGFAIRGAGQFTGAGIHVYGVYFRDASGSVESNSIREIRPEPFAASFAHALHVVDTDPADDTKLKLRIESNQIDGYGQMGIDVSGAASVRIERNVIAGMGATDQVAQLGAILRSVAKGRVSNNQIAAHWYTPFRAASGLVLENSSRVRIQGNLFDGNYEALSVSGASHRNRVLGNELSGGLVGIAVRGVPGAPAERNRVTRNTIAGYGGAGVLGFEIFDAARTRITRNALEGFAEFVSDFGTDTRFSRNTCDGGPC